MNDTTMSVEKIRRNFRTVYCSYCGTEIDENLAKYAWDEERQMLVPFCTVECIEEALGDIITEN